LSNVFIHEKRSSIKHQTSLSLTQWDGHISQLVFRKRNKEEKAFWDKRWLTYRRSTLQAELKDLHSKVGFTVDLQVLMEKKTNRQNFDSFC